MFAGEHQHPLDFVLDAFEPAKSGATFAPADGIAGQLADLVVSSVGKSFSTARPYSAAKALRIADGNPLAIERHEVAVRGYDRGQRCGRGDMMN